MSFITAAPSFLQSFTSRGVFSSETAFQKPRMPNSMSGLSSQGFSKRIPVNGQASHEKNVKNQKVKHSIDNDDDLSMFEPIKKLKVKCEKDFCSSERLTATRTYKNSSSVVKLTVAEVFGEPVKPVKSTKVNFFDDDDQNDDSSLSFISSSYSSLDQIEEEPVDPKRNGQEKDFEPVYLNNQFSSPLKEEVPHQGVTEPLVVRDNVLSSFKNKECINSDDVFIPPHVLNYQQLLPLTHYHTLQSSNLLQNIQAFRNIDLINQFSFNQLLGYNQQSFYPQYNMMSHHHQNNIYEELLRLEQNKLVIQSRNAMRVKNEDGYDSDSQATKSTSLEQENPSSEDILNGGKYPKTSSPFSNMSEADDLEKTLRLTRSLSVQETKNEGKKESSLAGKPKKEINKTQNNKKKRGENLKLDLQPQQLKVERRLNKLQLLRYQQGEIEEEVPLFQIPEETNHKVINEEAEYLEQLLQCQAFIPPFNLDEPLRRRSTITLRWNPQDMPTEDINDYIQRLSDTIQSPITDQEGALKLLRSHKMDVKRVIEIVQEDIAFYKELFRMKVKRCRRR